MNISKKIIEKIRKDIKKKENDKAKLLKSVTDKKIEKILKVLRKNTYIIEEDVAYNAVKGINLIEFNNFCYYLKYKYLTDFDSNAQCCYKGPFPEYRAYFQYKRTKFILSLLLGQGASWGLFILNPMLFDENKKIIIKC
jgi:hypothetical protein